MSAQNMIEIANRLSYVAKLRIEVNQVHHVKKVSDNGCSCIDVYGVTVNNGDNTNTVYLCAPGLNAPVKSVTLPRSEYKLVHIWQTGDVTHVGNHSIAW